ncbi:MAG: FixH family protein [Paracoccaceae bacterium]
MTVVAKPAQKSERRRPLTGLHVLAIFMVFFGVIIAVNVGLAWKAISTFPGLEVENGYVASQTFDVEMAAQKALGWVLVPKYDVGTDRLTLAFTDATGKPVTVAALSVLVGRTTEAVDDVTPVFVLTDGVYAAPAKLAKGKWMMAIEAHAADGTLFRQRIDLLVSR